MRNKKHRYSFVLVKSISDTRKVEFIGMFQSPKVPQRISWMWALKIVRDFLRKNNIPFEDWNNYVIYPVCPFNCGQFDNVLKDCFYDHIHVAELNKEDDEEEIASYNDFIKSKYKPIIV